MINRTMSDNVLGLAALGVAGVAFAMSMDSSYDWTQTPRQKKLTSSSASYSGQPEDSVNAALTSHKYAVLEKKDNHTSSTTSYNRAAILNRTESTNPLVRRNAQRHTANQMKRTGSGKIGSKIPHLYLDHY